VAEAPKLAQRLAERIETEILDRALPPGHRLGTEVDLIERYGVSRAVLREAIRIVERHQLAESRRGSGGGLFVAQPAEEAVAQVMCAYLESIHIEIPELFEALRLVQGEVVRLAAQRGSSTAAAALRRTLEAQAVPAPLEEEARRFAAFYARIAELAESPALALFVRALDQASEHVGLGLRVTREEAVRDWKALRKQMLEICDAVGAGRAAVAEKCMTRYLEMLERSFLTRKPRSTRRVPAELKRSDALAREIMYDLQRAGLSPGESLGPESELIEQYQVSRATLREAVRLLEQHGVAQMRRGLGGGLIVAEPDPRTVIRSASGYLAHLGLTVDHFREARLLIEPATAALAAERASDDERSQLSRELGEILALEGIASGMASLRLHEHIADLSRNRVLALFARVLITAAWGPEPHVDLPRKAFQRIQQNAVGIVGAIERSDAEGAQRRMREHLELTIRWWAELRPAGRRAVTPRGTRRRRARPRR
jgi:DNA-binding FadR family transcriptional regulator